MPRCPAWATAAQISQSEEFRHASGESAFSALEGKACGRVHGSTMGLETDISQKGVTVEGWEGGQGLLHLTTPSCRSISRMGWDYPNSTGEEVEA